MWLDIVNYHTTSNGDNTSNHLYENYLSQLRQELVECVCVIFFFLKVFQQVQELVGCCHDNEASVADVW